MFSNQLLRLKWPFFAVALKVRLPHPQLVAVAALQAVSIYLYSVKLVSHNGQPDNLNPTFASTNLKNLILSTLWLIRAL